MGKLRIGQKLALIAIAFSLPITVQLYFVVKGFTDPREFNQKELYGDEYIKPLVDLMEGLSHYRLAVHQAKTGGSGKDVGEWKGRVDAALAAVKAVDVKFIEPLQTSLEKLAVRKREHLRPETIIREWEDVSSKLASLSADDADAKIVHLIADARGLIGHIGDTSNLILDPDLDTYYTMDALLLWGPKTMDRIQGIIAEIGWAAKAGRLSGELMNKSRVHAAMLQADIDQVDGDIQTVLNEDANFQGFTPSVHQNLPPVTKKYDETAGALKAMLEKPEQASADELMKAGQEALGAGYAAWRTQLQEEDVMIQRRVDFYTKGMNTAVGLSGAALLVSIVLVIYIAMAITKPLGQAVAIAGQMALGDMQVSVDVTSEDETGRLLQAMKEMARKLSSVISQVRSAASTIKDASNTVNMATQDLATGTMEQSVNIANVVESISKAVTGEAGKEATRALQEVDKATQGNAEAADSLAKAAKDMDAKAAELKKLVGYFKVAGNGAG